VAAAGGRPFGGIEWILSFFGAILSQFWNIQHSTLNLQGPETNCNEYQRF
jgi:hypothetical protein